MIYEQLATEKGKPIEKWGRKAEDLRYEFYYDGRAAWNTTMYFGSDSEWQ